MIHAWGKNTGANIIHYSEPRAKAINRDRFACAQTVNHALMEREHLKVLMCCYPYV
jgi:hypothetical protein